MGHLEEVFVALLHGHLRADGVAAQVQAVALYLHFSLEFLLFGIEVAETQRVKVGRNDGLGEFQFEAILFHPFGLSLQLENAERVVVLEIAPLGAGVGALELGIYWKTQMFQFGLEHPRGVSFAVVYEEMKRVRGRFAGVEPQFKAVLAGIELGDDFVGTEASEPEGVDPHIGCLETDIGRTQACALLVL